MPLGSDDLTFGLKIVLDDKFSAEARRIVPLLERMDRSLEEIERQLRETGASGAVAAGGIKKAGTQAKKTSVDLDKLSRDLNRAGTAFLKLGGIIAGAFVIAGAKGFKLLQDEEKVLAGLTYWLGDTAEAYRFLGEAREFAVRTPWAETAITGTDPLLLAAGVDPRNIEHTRLVISDLAASMGKDYAEAAQAAISAQFGEYESMKRFGMMMNVEAFRDAGEFAGLTVFEAIEQTLMEKEEAIGELTEGFAGTMTARLSNVQARFEEVLREGTRQIFEAIGDDLDSLLDWFDQAAESGEFQEMIEGFAAGLQIIFEVGRDLLGVLTDVINVIGVENIAKILAFAAKWSLFAGVAFKVASAVTKIISVVRKLSGVLTWATAGPIAIAAVALGGLIWLITSLTPEPIDQLAESFDDLMSDLEGHQQRVNALTKEFEDNRDRMKELGKLREGWVKLSPDVIEAHRLEIEQLKLKNDELGTSIELETDLMQLKAQESFQKMRADWRRLEVSAGGGDIIMQAFDLIGWGQEAEARNLARLAYEAKTISWDQYMAVRNAAGFARAGLEERAAEWKGKAFGLVSTAMGEQLEYQAVTESYAGIVEYSPEQRAWMLGEGFDIGAGTPRGFYTGGFGMSAAGWGGAGGEEEIIPTRIGGTLGGGGGGGRAAVPTGTPRLSVAGLAEFAENVEVAGRTKALGGGNKFEQTFIFNVPVDENMANYVANKARQAVNKVFDESGVL